MNKINARHNKRKKEKSTSVKCRRPKSSMRDKCKNLRHSKNYWRNSSSRFEESEKKLLKRN